MKLRKQGDWIEYVTDQGKTFYYNEKNGDFQWIAPSPGKGKKTTFFSCFFPCDLFRFFLV